MSGNNGFFKLGDERAYSVGGYPIHEAWWSRIYEYPWAFQFARPGDVCADMGCGWMPRPFKDALATVCKRVYAVDASRELLRLGNTNPRVLQFVIADFTQRIPAIRDESLDRVYCISVLEDTGPGLWDAMAEFARCLKPDGRIVLTCDIKFDDVNPLGKYPAVELYDLFDAVDYAGLDFDGEIDEDKTGAVFNEEFNLCVWHCVLKRRDGN